MKNLFSAVASAPPEDVKRQIDLGRGTGDEDGHIDSLRRGTGTGTADLAPRSHAVKLARPMGRPPSVGRSPVRRDRPHSRCIVPRRMQAGITRRERFSSPVSYRDAAVFRFRRRSRSSSSASFRS